MRQNLLAWTVDAAPSRTRSVYRRLETGAARSCGCADCRNFDAARPDHFSSPLTALLQAVAADPCKEATVSLVSPLEGGRSLYSGSYLFCGVILAGRPHRGFPFLTERVDVFEELDGDTHVTLRPVPAPEGAWAGHDCVRLEFLVVLPWLIAERSLRAVNLDRMRRSPPS